MDWLKEDSFQLLMCPLSAFGKDIIPLPAFGKDIVPLPAFGKDIVPLPSFGKDIVPLSAFGNDIVPLPAYGKDIEVLVSVFHTSGRSIIAKYTPVCDVVRNGGDHRRCWNCVEGPSPRSSGVEEPLPLVGRDTCRGSGRVQLVHVILTLQVYHEGSH